ncbi:2-oxoacid:acceptor oxidoreductase family protein, partial [bacterium]|nr:2-oxoacid:acceptor oxidoreductase family protein [bacterium]MBU1025008.1 2-oxoacid:acceptor oxidoreductase family protein [bacterium]
TASIYGGKFATMTQSFGPEARGSSCSAQLVIDEDQVEYPYLQGNEILVSMSQDAYNRFEPFVNPDGLVLIDEDLVKPGPPRDNIRMYSVPAMKFSEEIGNIIVLNIIMFGFFVAMTDGLLDYDSAVKAIETSVPPRTIELNMIAFNKGYDHGKALLEENASTSSSD